MSLRRTAGVLLLALAAGLGPAAMAAADDGNDFSWSTAGTNDAFSTIDDPVAGHCYTLSTSGQAEYAYNETDLDARYFSGAGCRHQQGVLAAGMFGNITDYVVFSS
ncbi:MAG TPA: hypothetical protein VGX23_21825 [Actinocrinis sp.]|nr:hypothetical protein [Actinocrinis sp.]